MFHVRFQTPRASGRVCQNREWGRWSQPNRNGDVFSEAALHQIREMATNLASNMTVEEFNAAMHNGYAPPMVSCSIRVTGNDLADEERR